MALAWRAAIGVLTPIPSEDGVNYLWMAERFADARPDLALTEVFPPLFSLAISPFVWLGLDPFRAGQLAAGLVGALAVFPIVRIVEHFEPDAGKIAAWFVAFAPMPTRLAAEVYSEPAFHLMAAAAILSALRKRSFESGLWSGMACWARPEGLLVGLAFAVTRPRQAPAILLGAALPILLLAGWRSSATGEPFALFPKAGFNADRLWEEAPGVFEFLGHFAGNLIAIPWLWCEAFAILAVLAAIGLFTRRRELWPLRWMLVFGIVVICAFLARRRFLVTWFVAVIPLAVIGLRWLPARARDAAFIATLILNILLSLRVQDANRITEREVGEYLAEKLGPDDLVSGDMTRVIYFAGRRPLPPKHFTIDELVDRARGRRVRFVVLGSFRKTTGAVVERLEKLGFEDYRLPAENRRDANARGIRVLGRQNR